MTLPQQNESQRRGMQAADIVALALSKVAFVNRVATEVDIGVDFMCEWRSDDQPRASCSTYSARCFLLRTKTTPSRPRFR